MNAILARGRQFNRVLGFAFLTVLGFLVFNVVTTGSFVGSSVIIETEDGALNQAEVVESSEASGGSYIQFNEPIPQPPAGGQPFAASSPFNKTIPSNATWRDELTIRDNYWWLNREQYSMPYAVAAPNDPLVQVDVPSSWGWPAGPISIRAPAGLTGDSGTDASIVIRSDNTVCDFWQFSRKSDTYATAVAYACTDYVTGSGFGTQSPFKGAGIRAAGSSTLGGLLLGSDFANESKNQALAVSLRPVSLKRGWVYPAISEDSGNGYSGTVPVGSRLGIPPGTARPSGLSAHGIMIWNTLQTYGAYVLDQHHSDASLIFYADPRSTNSGQVNNIRTHWESGKDSLHKIMPYIRVCTSNCL